MNILDITLEDCITENTIYKTRYEHDVAMDNYCKINNMTSVIIENNPLCSRILTKLLINLESKFKNNHNLNYCSAKNIFLDNKKKSVLDDIDNFGSTLQISVFFHNTYSIKYNNIKYIIKHNTLYYDNGEMPLNIFIIFSESINSTEHLLKKLLEQVPNNVSCYEYYEQNKILSIKSVSSHVQPLLLFGKDVSNVMDSINKDIEFYNKNFEKLDKLGITTGLSYLIFGPPGNGKTSLSSNIACSNNYNIYVVNMSKISKENLSSALGGNPIGHYTKDNVSNTDKFNKIILVEDFDRYLKSNEKGIYNDTNISELLNSLDGLISTNNVIRIFTANIKEKIDDPALISRFKRIFYINNPDLDTIIDVITNICKLFDIEIFEDKIILLANLFKNNNFNIRNINKYFTRFIEDPKPIDTAINNFKEYVKEITLEYEEKKQESIYI
ncbi:AAA family ATPase [Hokovirus HKV1]|uniref:AAA family ATPase n=1 Tax=Hokovirus HKV1 TaxID=1977638 RepID=A0A1V0SFD3_9VIRU|nr:AAA family ATPase [Hokovirus HKV1]